MANTVVGTWMNQIPSETGKETRVIKQEREEEEINGVCCLANDRL